MGDDSVVPSKKQQPRVIAITAGVLATGTVITLAWLLEPVRTWLLEVVKDAVSRLLELVKDLGPLGYVIFGTVYAALDLASIPTLGFATGAGAIFGMVPAITLVMLAGTISAGAAFLIGRWCFQSNIRRWTATSSRFHAIEKAMTRRGFQVVLLLRFFPIPIPFLNYLFGVTAIKFRSYILATALGYLPGTFALVFAGVAGKSVAQGRVPLEALVRDRPWYQILGASAAVCFTLWAVCTAVVNIVKDVKQAGLDLQEAPSCGDAVA